MRWVLFTREFAVQLVELAEELAIADASPPSSHRCLPGR
jgi:hypothetical protein